MAKESSGGNKSQLGQFQQNPNKKTDNPKNRNALGTKKTNNNMQ